MGIEKRLRKLEAERGPELCEERFCMRRVTTELVLHPDGRKERIGNPSPPLCAICPHVDDPNAPIRHIEVVLDRRGDH
jgi:hypothetical protein